MTTWTMETKDTTFSESAEIILIFWEDRERFTIFEIIFVEIIVRLCDGVNAKN